MPISFPQRADDIESKPESVVFRALQQVVSEDWILIHSVSGVEQLPGRKARRWEADIVAVHAQFGVVVVEVKGGAVRLVNNQWKQNRRVLRNDPVTQVFDAAGSLQRQLRQELRAREMTPELVMDWPVRVLLAFPDSGWSGSPPNGITSDQILDLDDFRFGEDGLLRPKTRVMLQNRWLRFAEVATDAASLTDLQKASVIESCVRTGAADADLAETLRSTLSSLEDHTGQLLDATDEQLQAMLLLGIAPRVCVTGPPGTGKTLLARRRARDASDEGKRVLLIGAPGRVIERMRAEFSEVQNVFVGTVDDLAAMFEVELGQDLKMKVPESPKSPASAERVEFERQLIAFFESLLHEHAEAACRFDSLVVDEAQSITPLLLSVLEQLVLRSPFPEVHIFADPIQRIEAGAWQLPSGFYPQPLLLNCRNTDQISLFFSKSSNTPQPTTPQTGPNPRVFVVPGDGEKLSGELLQLAGTVIADLLNDGVSLDDLVVLTNGWERETLAFFLRETWPNIDVDDMYRFRGEEASTVVTVLARGSARSRYVALSRAKALQVVVANQRAFRQIDDNRMATAISFLANPDDARMPDSDNPEALVAWHLACQLDGANRLSSR